MGEVESTDKHFLRNTYSHSECHNHLMELTNSDRSNAFMIPTLVCLAVDKRVWEGFEGLCGKWCEYPSFVEYCEATAPWGLGMPFEELRRICAADPKALNALDSATQRKPGEHTGNQYTQRENGNLNNVKHSKYPEGNTAQAAIRRLRM